MILKTLKSQFSLALTDYYPETEIDSFFHLLSENILKLKRIEISQHLYMVVSGKKHDKFKIAIEHLIQQKPIQYLFGKTDFYGQTFIVNEHVLIPRPETEELVDIVIKDIKHHTKALNILDIGTGSGCIAISLAKHLPNATIFALDVSSDALEIAKKNAKLNDVAIHFIEADILDANLWQSQFESITFDCIVSNPPYVRELEKEHMKANVLDHEPHLALFVKDSDPLIFYRNIAQFASTYLNKNGKLYYEINEFLGNEMKDLLIGSDFYDVELIKDMSGKDRIIKATKY